MTRPRPVFAAPSTSLCGVPSMTSLTDGAPVELLTSMSTRCKCKFLMPDIVLSSQLLKFAPDRIDSSYIRHVASFRIYTTLFSHICTDLITDSLYFKVRSSWNHFRVLSYICKHDIRLSLRRVSTHASAFTVCRHLLTLARLTLIVFDCVCFPRTRQHHHRRRQTRPQLEDSISVSTTFARRSQRDARDASDASRLIINMYDERQRR